MYLIKNKQTNICFAHFRMNYCVLSRTFMDRSHFLLDLWIKGNEEQSYYDNQSLLPWCCPSGKSSSGTKLVSGQGQTPNWNVVMFIMMIYVMRPQTLMPPAHALETWKLSIFRHVEIQRREILWDCPRWKHKNVTVYCFISLWTHSDFVFFFFLKLYSITLSHAKQW